MDTAKKYLLLLLIACMSGFMLSGGMAESDGWGMPAAPDALALSEATEAPPEPEATVEADAPAEKGLEIYFLDLERVDGILIRCDGEDAFIDVGFKRDAKPALAYMEALGVEKLGCYIGTHAHADHVAGAAQIIHKLRPDAIYIPHRRVRTAILNNATSREKESVRATKTVTLKHGESFQIGGAEVKCLGPIRIVDCSIGDNEENSNSLILKLTYGARTFLFTGDTTSAVLRSVNKKYPGELDCDVLKNAHHNGSLDADVVKAISPRATVFCTDNENQPARDYLRMLEKTGSDNYITGSRRHGNVRISSDGAGVEIYCGYPLSELTLNPVPGTMVPGQTYQLTGALKPSGKANARKWLNWRSSDSGVVKVSGGKLTAVAEGTATITASSINGLTSAVEVRVLDVGVVLEKYAVSLNLGDEIKLRAKLAPSGASGVTGEWISEDESVAIVTPAGEIIGMGVGETRVWARLSNGAEAACAVRVTDIPVTSVELSYHSVSMKLDDQTQLSLKISPSDASNKTLEWRSSDESVVTVDIFGNVTAVGVGSAKVGVRAASGAYDVCAVTVEDE